MTHQIEVPHVNNQYAAINLGERGIEKSVTSVSIANARHWGIELNTSNKYTKYCHHGKVSTYESPQTPTLLLEQLTWDTQKANNYVENIREYNTTIPFA
jgi:hypothetical protein